ncbi:MAG: methyltransferase [Pseudomonadota bacterium]
MTAGDTDEITEDVLLGGRVRLLQPATGYRAATDPVLMAAAAPATGAIDALDLGCGVGAASLCLAARAPEITVHGLEVQEAYANLARRNAEMNSAAFTVHTGDLRDMPRALKELTFDIVMLNPPWHAPEALASPDPGRDLANRRQGVMLEIWLTAALSRLRPGGWLMVIQRIEALPEILGSLAHRTGDIAVLPLAARVGRDAKRMIVKARKGSRGPFRLAAPLIMHAGASHVSDGDDFTDQARAILRDGAALDF